jgi:hypothetical protein
MSNALWQIAFGDYDLTVDRRTLTYRLVETKTGTLWANGLSLGWMALEERATGAILRRAFGEMKLLSVSEKSGAMGKRILFGLDWDGVPVDVYVIAGLREVQIIVEANRDTATHRVHGFGLLPGVCTVPEDKHSYLVIPRHLGEIRFPCDVPEEPISLPIWDDENGVSMPFVGAVQESAEKRSGLALITDSAYGRFRLSKSADEAITADTEYVRDPERRRLDLRAIVLPDGDYIAVARTYREKIIADGNHVTLRRKMRERPERETVIGAMWAPSPAETALPPVTNTSERTVWCDMFTSSEEIGFFYDALNNRQGVGKRTEEKLAHSASAEHSLWDTLETQTEQIREIRSRFPLVGSTSFSDWQNIAIDFILSPWWLNYGYRSGENSAYGPLTVPLYTTVYHDSVILPALVWQESRIHFLITLLNLSPPNISEDNSPASFLASLHALLCPLHRLTYTAFLTEHSFLTETNQVQEAYYSDRTQVIVNFGDANYERTSLILPPQGFYVRHPQMEAHDALHVGDTTFTERVWRIRRSLDGKPLEESQDILTQEFPSPFS